MPITSEHQALIITNALMELRPSWNRSKILELLSENRGCDAPFGAIIQACVTYANDPGKHTPQFLFQDGKHWPATTTTARRPPVDPCEDHPEEAAHNCRCCWADARTGLRPETHIGTHYDIPTT